MIKRHIIALFHQERCNRTVLIPMLDNMSKAELQALWRLLQNIQQDAKRAGGQEQQRGAWWNGGIH